jgi:hypothetical protein
MTAVVGSMSDVLCMCGWWTFCCAAVRRNVGLDALAAMNCLVASSAMLPRSLGTPVAAKMMLQLCACTPYYIGT